MLQQPEARSDLTLDSCSLLGRQRVSPPVISCPHALLLSLLPPGTAELKTCDDFCYPMIYFCKRLRGLYRKAHSSFPLISTDYNGSHVLEKDAAIQVEVIFPCLVCQHRRSLLLPQILRLMLVLVWGSAGKAKDSL